MRGAPVALGFLAACVLSLLVAGLRTAHAWWLRRCAAVRAKESDKD